MPTSISPLMLSSPLTSISPVIIFALTNMNYISIMPTSIDC